MDKFDVTTINEFAKLPFDKFQALRSSVYVLDKKWNYLFVNDFVAENLGRRGANLVGKNMWSTFPELNLDINFGLLKANTEKGVSSNFITTSPINGQRLNIVGHALRDCNLFFSTILPNKNDLLNELRGEIAKTNGKPN